MFEELIQINPPLFIANCGADMPVMAIIAPNVSDTEKAVCILSKIQELPRSVLDFIQERFPTFKKKYSKTMGYKYYANTCPKCGVLSGDFHLHSEPGAPFFPTTDEEASELTIESVPIKSSFKVSS